MGEYAFSSEEEIAFLAPDVGVPSRPTGGRVGLPQSGGFGFPSKNGFVLVFDFVLFDLYLRSETINLYRFLHWASTATFVRQLRGPHLRT